MVLMSQLRWRWRQSQDLWPSHLRLPVPALDKDRPTPAMILERQLCQQDAKALNDSWGWFILAVSSGCPLRIMCRISMPESVTAADRKGLNPSIGRTSRLIDR